MTNKNKVLNYIINGRTKYSNIQYNSPVFIGSISKIFSDNKFRSFDEYKEYYTNNVFGYDRLLGFADRIHEEVGHNFNVSSEEIFSYLLELIFDKSWNGFVERTRQAVLFLEKQNFDNIEEANEDFDRKYAIDFFASRNGKRYIIQVKPNTFLDEYYKYHYVRNLKKNLKFVNEFDESCLVLYLFYGNKKFSHKLFDKSSLEEEIFEKSKS